MSAPPAGKQGIGGAVRRGPITPVCSAETTCTEPAPSVPVVILQGDVVVAHVTTGPDGLYYVLAAPGAYVVRAVGRGLHARATRVQPNRFAEVDFMIDTGIR